MASDNNPSDRPPATRRYYVAAADLPLVTDQTPAMVRVWTDENVVPENVQVVVLEEVQT